MHIINSSITKPMVSYERQNDDISPRFNTPQIFQNFWQTASQTTRLFDIPVILQLRLMAPPSPPKIDDHWMQKGCQVASCH